MSVDTLITKVNQKEIEEHGDEALVLSKGRTYQIIKQLKYSSKQASKVIGIGDAEAEIKRQTDLHRLYDETSIVTDINDYVFVDECSITIGDLRKEQRLISEIGSKSYIHSKACDKYTDVRLTAVVFISATGEKYIGSVYVNMKKEIFEDVLNRFLAHTKKEFVYLLLDGSRNHSKQLLDYIYAENDKFAYSFLPRYSPDTNAAEPIHHMLKTQIRHALEKSIKSVESHLKDATMKAIHDFEVSPNVAHNAVLSALQILCAMNNRPYEEAVKSVRNSHKKRRPNANIE